MIAFLILVYVGVLFLLIRFKVIASSKWAWLSVAPYTVLLFVCLFIPMQFAAPSGGVIVWHPVTQIASRVNGQVIIVSAKMNEVVDKDTPLVTIDPRPFKYEVDRLTAAKSEAEKNVDVALAKVDAARKGIAESQAASEAARQAIKKAEGDLKYAEDELVINSKLAEKGTVSKTELNKAIRNAEVARAELPQTQAVARQAGVAVDHAKAIVRQAEAELAAAPFKVQQFKQQLETASYNLGQTVIKAPSRGRVVNLQIREGTSMSVGAPMLTFIPEEDGKVIVVVQENYLRHVRPDQPVEVAARFYPGKLLHGKVESVISITGEGQLTAGGVLPEAASLKTGGMFAVRVNLNEDSAVNDLPIGSGGSAAIFTDHMTPTHIIRRVMLRQQSWLFFVF